MKKTVIRYPKVKRIAYVYVNNTFSGYSLKELEATIDFIKKKGKQITSFNVTTFHYLGEEEGEHAK